MNVKITKKLINTLSYANGIPRDHVQSKQLGFPMGGTRLDKTNLLAKTSKFPVFFSLRGCFYDS